MKTRILLLALCLVVAPAARAARQLPATVRKNIERGDAWAQLGNWQRAVTAWQEVLRKHPRHFPTRLKLANGLYRLRRFKESLALLEHLARQRPGSVAVANARARLLLQLQRPRDACRIYRRVLRKHADNEAAAFGLGRCLQLQQQRRAQDSTLTGRVREAFQNYLKRFPNGPHAAEAHRALERLRLGPAADILAAARRALADGELARAETILRKLVGNQPDLEQAHYLLGLVLAAPENDKLEQALAEWEKAPHIKEALLMRSRAAFEDDELEQAQQLARQALARDGNYAEAHYQLGIILASQPEQQQDAARSFARVMQLAPRTTLAERAASKLQLVTGKLVMLREGEVIDRATEIDLGHKLSEQLEKQYPLVGDARLNERLSTILAKLARNADLPPGTLPFRVKVLDVPAINAIAFTGGTIYLFRGLVDFISKEFDDSEDAYAIVLGHELVHLVLRHGLRMLDLVSGSRSLLQGNSFDARGLGKLMVGLSRQHEFQADQIGCLVAYRAGFNPGLAYRFHRRLVARGMEVPDGTDHPTHRERAERIKEYLLGLRAKARYFDSGLRALDEGDFTAAVAHFEVFLGAFPRNFAARNNLGVAKHHLALSKAVSGRPWRLSTDIDPRSGLSRIRVRGTGQEEASRGVNLWLLREAAALFSSLVREDATYLPARINLAACQMELGQNQQARRQLEKLRQLHPDSPEIMNNLAVASFLAGDDQGGIELLQATLSRHPRHPEALYNLAMALTRRGQPEGARRAWLEFLKQDDSSGWAGQAREQLAGLR